MGLREDLLGVLILGYDAQQGASQPAQAHLAAVRKSMYGYIPPLGYTVRVSGSAQNLPLVPWVAVLDRDVTRTAQAGLYVVYLYSASMERVYLSMNQGATAHRQHAASTVRPKGVTIDAASIAELQAESAAIRGELAGSLIVGLVETINLGSAGFLPRAYEAGSIVAREYNLASLPSEEELRGDLDRFLLLYQASVSARAGLTAVDPATFYAPTLPAGRTSGVSSDDDELFKPKSSSDYVAAIAAHIQVRTRKHEAVVKAYGEHAKGLGWTPNTKVHPRDLVLRRSSVDILCEVKVVKANAQFAVREALGQLFTYRHFLYAEGSPVKLVAVFSDEVGQAFVDLLEQLGVGSVWSLGGTTWAGSATATQLGLV